MTRTDRCTNDFRKISAYFLRASQGTQENPLVVGLTYDRLKNTPRTT